MMRGGGRVTYPVSLNRLYQQTLLNEHNLNILACRWQISQPAKDQDLNHMPLPGSKPGDTEPLNIVTMVLPVQNINETGNQNTEIRRILKKIY